MIVVPSSFQAEISHLLPLRKSNLHSEEMYLKYDWLLKLLKGVLFKSLTHPMYIARMHMISRRFPEARKYRIYHYMGNLFPFVNNRAKQARFFTKNHIFDSPTFFLR